MIITILGFFCGDLVFQLLPALPNLIQTISLLILFFFLLIVAASCCCFVKQAKLCWALKFLSALFLGFLYALFLAKLIGKWELPQSLEGQKILVTGYVSDLPERKANHLSFNFTTETIAGVAERAKLHLGWYDGKFPNVEAGDKWQLMVKLKRPHSMLNPGGFDYEKYLWQHKIRATGYVLNSADNKPLPSLSRNYHNYYRYAILRLRQNIENKITKALGQAPLYSPQKDFQKLCHKYTRAVWEFREAARSERQECMGLYMTVANDEANKAENQNAKGISVMINALVVGDQSGISKAEWQVFRDTGTSYLMAIAGLHICLAAGVIFFIAQYLWRLSGRLMLWLPARQAAAIFGFLAAIIYSIISGFSLPTERALIMLAVFVITFIMRRQTTLWHALFLALFSVLLIDPMAVLAVGFWLSFAAVILIFYVTCGRRELSNAWWRKYGRMQWAITLGLAPITLIFFADASFITFVANIIALPGVCSLVVPLSLAGSLFLFILLFLGKFLLLSAAKILELIFAWLKWLTIFSQIHWLSWLNWQHSVFHWWHAALALVGVFLILSPRGFFGKLVGTFWIFPLIFFLAPQPKYGEIWFSVLDVGEGLATVIQTEHHVIVYDTGPKFADSDAGEMVVVPFLQESGIENVDAMVVSHGDDDHSGGANSIMKLLRVNKIITSVPDKFPTKLTQSCYRGQKWEWDGVNFNMLFPPPNIKSDGGNKTCCVLRVDNGKNSILLPADIEKAEEKYLVNEAKALGLGSEEMQNSKMKSFEKEGSNINLRASILVAPHHGSATSSTPEFIEAVNPQYVIFSSGYHNRFGFPISDVVERYRKLGIKILETKDSGAIMFRLAGKKQPKEKQKADNFSLLLSLYREAMRRYWRP